MVKNKGLPDFARLCQTLQTLPSGHSLCHSLSLSLSLPRRFGPIKAGLTCLLSLSRWCRSSWGYPLDPAEAGPQHIALPVQALGGLLCLGFFSVLQRVRPMEGPPWVGSYSVVQGSGGIDGPASLLFSCRWWGVGRERLCWWLHLLCVTDSAVTALLPWLPDFPPQEFPATVSSLTSLGSLSPQSTAVLALGFLYNP